jgi:hypothetical protein
MPSPERVRADLRLAGARATSSRRTPWHRRRVTSLLLRIIVDAAPMAGAAREPGDRGRPGVGDSAQPDPFCLPPGIPETLIQRGLMLWTGLSGVISFEVNGQRPEVARRNPVTVTHSSPSTSGAGSLS